MVISASRVKVMDPALPSTVVGVARFIRLPKEPRAAEVAVAVVQLGPGIQRGATGSDHARIARLRVLNRGQPMIIASPRSVLPSLNLRRFQRSNIGRCVSFAMCSAMSLPITGAIMKP